MEHLPTPLPAKPAPKPITFRDRLLVDNKNTTRSPPKKPRTHYSAASLFDRHRKPTIDGNDSSIDPLRPRRYQPSPSPEPEPPIISELTTRYTELRTTLHSSIVTRLEEAQKELTTQAVDSIKTRQIALAQLQARSNQLHAPLRTAKIDYEAVGEDGQKRRTTEEAQAEIEELGREEEALRAVARPSSSEDDGGGGKRRDGDFPKLSSGMSPSHREIVLGFASDLDKESKEVVEEMVEYEKEFLQKIEDEASSIVQSFLSH
ncbi:hypothetical protein F4809DRAFT_642825 [Biscogniauxia mediterranea]|nr:hypothetical protein F4809DRAFT_642825 [Biscogniauxia mediterranea]